MNKDYLIKIGEIALKSGNRKYFENQLKQNVLHKLKNYQCSFSGRQGRYFLSAGDVPEDAVFSALSASFGITGYCETYRTEKNIEAIKKTAEELIEKNINGKAGHRFKVEARRSDKSFPLTSYQIACTVGDYILERFPQFTVDVHSPDWVIHCEIRERAVIYGSTFPGPGGLPVGSAGRGTLLLSGGIDSPVAGYLMAKRGVRMNAVYFHAHPFTSEQAKEKVIKLAGIIAPYLAGPDLYIVPFTDVQMHIKKHGKEEETTLLMRACMMQIAESIAGKTGGKCLITGESLSQVASQTIESLTFTGSVPSMPVFRPLIGLDKEEIIRIAEQIGTFQTSILPYEDCCTIFSPKRPLVKPLFSRMENSYRELHADELLQEAASNASKIECGDIIPAK